MAATLPFLTSYDAPGSSEGTLDPLGLYQIADQLAVQLVPAVRERMKRIRFLTAMAVGALVTDGLESASEQRDHDSYLVWEWLVVEALVRASGDDTDLRGVPGVLVTRRALHQHDYVDARSYLKTARIFGFNGVYKRLATHLGIVNVHLSPDLETEPLADAWARGLGYSSIRAARPVLARWTSAIQRSLAEKPPRTRPGWSVSGWTELAQAFDPNIVMGHEKKYLRNLLNANDHRRLGALPNIWELQSNYGDDYEEEQLHLDLQKREPAFRILLEAIRAYEAFARSLQDGFDLLLSAASIADTNGYCVTDIASDRDFRRSVAKLNRRFESSRQALAALPTLGQQLQNLFDERFGEFSEPLDPAAVALKLCAHHKVIQRAKSAEGKRAWFDPLGADRIYVRHAYRQPRPDVAPERYLHGYRGNPIRQFFQDLR